MARAYSQDLRERVIASAEAGMLGRYAAARFGVGISTAIRWLVRESGLARRARDCRVGGGVRGWMRMRPSSWG